MIVKIKLTESKNSGTADDSIAYNPVITGLSVSKAIILIGLFFHFCLCCSGNLVSVGW